MAFKTKHIILFLLLTISFASYSLNKGINKSAVAKYLNSVMGPTVGIHPGDTSVIINAFTVDTINNKIYIAGKFTSYNGVLRKNLVRIDLKTGAVETTWQPKCSGEVSDILFSNNKVFIIGELDTIAGVPKRYVASIDTAGNFIWVWGNNKPCNGCNISFPPCSDTTFTPIDNVNARPKLLINSGQLLAFNFGIDSFSGNPFGWYTKINKYNSSSFNLSNGSINAGAWNLLSGTYNYAPNQGCLISRRIENIFYNGSAYCFITRNYYSGSMNINYQDSGYYPGIDAVILSDPAQYYYYASGTYSFNGECFPSLSGGISKNSHVIGIDKSWICVNCQGQGYYSKNSPYSTLGFVTLISGGVVTLVPNTTNNYYYEYITKNYTVSPIDPITGLPSAYINNEFVAYSTACDYRFAKTYFGINNMGFKSVTTAAQFIAEVSEPSLGYYISSNATPDTIIPVKDSSIYHIKSCEPKGLFIYQNKLLNISSWHPSQTKRIDYINAYCLQTEGPAVKFLSLPTSTVNGFQDWEICANSPNKLVLKKRFYAAETYYSYTGTGITITGNTTGVGDSVNVNTSLIATPGILKIVQKSDCGRYSDTLKINIFFKPIPNLTVGANQFYTCTTNTAVLNAATTVSNYNIAWTNPAATFISSQITNVIVTKSIDGTGNFTATLTDNSTGCSNYSVVTVGMDTLKPIVTFPATNDYTLTCKKLTVALDVNAPSPLDSVKWAGNAYTLNTATKAFSLPGTYYVQCYSNNNGCVGRDSVKINLVTVPPPYTFTPAFTSITCLRDSFLLQTTSTNTNVIVYWKSLAIGPFTTDSLFGNIYADSAIAYNATIIDTVSGCKTLNTFIVKDSTLKPFLVLPNHSQVITCSSAFINLTGSSPSSGTSLQWFGPAGYTSSNPANINATGTYTFVVTDNANGCKKTDTVNVTRQNILLLQTKNDTVICSGSAINIFTQPLGGTSPYTVNWSSGASGNSIAVTPAVTVKYSVTVIDALGCIGKDTVIVTVPSIITDSTVNFQPCDPNNPNGQIQVYPKGGIQPYSFSLNGSSFQSSNVFTNLAFGTYSFTIKDAIGCTKTGSSQISSISLAPQNDFLVSTNIYKVDTFVVVDISNPKPDSVQWTFPSTFTVINNSNPYSPIVICSDTGYYNVSQTAYFGGCHPILSKQVHIKYSDGTFATPYNNNGIQSVTLSPNPNGGQFNLNVTMYKKQTFIIFVIDASGVEKLRIPVSDADSYSGNILVPQVTNGTYILKVISSYDARHIVFVVSQ